MNDIDMGADIQLVIHASTPEALQRARNNTVNLAREWPNATVEIVANGGAVPAALKQEHATDACLVLCENSIRHFELSVPEHLKTVPAAIVWLVERQRAGWQYISA